MTTDNQQPATDNVLRAFIAVEITAEVREKLAVLQSKLRKAGGRVGWVAPENIHLTMAFLGNVFAAQVAALSEALDAVAAGFKPFQFEVSDVGFFGSPKSPRIIWAGVAEEMPNLIDLQKLVAARVVGLGLPLENRPFKPHLTLGRVRSGKRADELTSALTSAKNTAFGWVPVQRLLLMQSHLEHQGVRYSILHESALKGA